MSGQPEAGALSAPVTGADPCRLRVAAVGISIDEICGVRDHARLLAGALEAQGVSCSLHWLQRPGGGSLCSERARIESWAHGLAVELEATGAEVVLLHYSVFSYSHKGVPLFAGPVLTAARQARLPVVTVLHEYAYPWRRDGLAGMVWAVSQRARLIGLMRASAAAVVTTARRAEWLRSRPWLARRPIEVVPVFSNLPPASAAPDPDRAPGAIGLFGYGYDEATIALVLDALRLLHGQASPLRLVLLGAPGEHSPAGERWARLARARGVHEALSFSGTLPAQELSDRLAACEALLFADPIGPTSRKTTLAASLSSGRPVIALDGPQRWPELVAAEAARVVVPSAEALAAALGELLADERLRESLGARGREFAERVGLARAARVVAELLARVLAQVGARAGSQAERAL